MDALILSDCFIPIRDDLFLKNHKNLFKQNEITGEQWKKLIESILNGDVHHSDLVLDFIIYVWNNPDSKKAVQWIDLNVKNLDSFVNTLGPYLNFFIDVYPIEELAKVIVIISRLLRRYDFVMKTKTLGKSYSTCQTSNLLERLASFTGESLEWILKVVFLVASSSSNQGGIVLAGGSLIKCLTEPFDLATISPHSDLDLWIYGENEEARKTIFDLILNIIVNRHKQDIVLKFESHYVTIIHKSAKTRPIQLILTNYQYPYQITDSFDQPYLGAYYDGTNVYMNFECHLALCTSLIDIPVDNLWVKRLKKSLDYRLISNGLPVWQEIINVLKAKKKTNIFKVGIWEQTFNHQSGDGYGGLRTMKLLSELEKSDKFETREQVIALLTDDTDDLDALRTAITNKKERIKFIDFVFDGDLTNKGKFNYKGYERHGAQGNYIVATAEDHVHISMADPKLLLNHALQSMINSRKIRIETVSDMDQHDRIVLSPAISIRLINVSIIVKGNFIIFNFKQNDEVSNRIIRKVDKKLNVLHHVVDQMIDVDKRFPAKPLICRKNYFAMFNNFVDLKPGRYKVNLDFHIEGWDIYEHGDKPRHTLTRAITKIELL